MQEHNIKVNAAQAADAIVKQFANQMDTFHSESTKAKDTLLSSIRGIETGWSGETYDEFKHSMESQIGQLESCLYRADALSKRLHDISAQFSRMIEMLKKSGN